MLGHVRGRLAALGGVFQIGARRQQQKRRAWLFGAGFAPLAALALSGKFGLVAGGAYLLSGAICTLLALWLNRELAKGRAGAKA